MQPGLFIHPHPIYYSVLNLGVRLNVVCEQMFY